MRARRLAGRAVRRLRPRPGPRLVGRPTFVLCTLRSGSTLLRVLLDGHSKIHAPHEIHLRYTSVRLENKYAERAMKAMDLSVRELEYLLWDRILERTLARSRKQMIVEKTPNDVFIADRLLECWPDARFIFLLRHPAAILRSRAAVLGERHDPEANLELIHRYCEALETARRAYDGHQVRYEELTADPEGALRGVCSFLGVRFEPAMIGYGDFKHGPYRAGLGDWKEKIRSGRVQPAEPPPDEIPEPLRDVARAWGYSG